MERKHRGDIILSGVFSSSPGPPAALHGRMKPLLTVKDYSWASFWCRETLFPIRVSSMERGRADFCPNWHPSSRDVPTDFLENIFNCCCWEVKVSNAFSFTACWSEGAFEAHFLQICFFFGVNHNIRSALVSPKYSSLNGRCGFKIKNKWYSLGTIIE